ncbi:MAG: hypothetical protein IKC03_04840 [Oscillospiraceae bacterium]|nr:hypothetical protein [Oscillospiraceae bacterium]
MKQDDVLAYLKDICPGRNNIQKSTEIEAALVLKPHTLTNFVHRLRVKGEPIASCSDGYFFASNASDVYRTIRYLTRIVEGLLEAIDGLERSLASFPLGGDVNATSVHPVDRKQGKADPVHQ